MRIVKLICCLFLLSHNIDFYTQEKYPAKDSLSILSWNIQMLPNFYAPFSKYVRKKQSKRLPEIIKYLETSSIDVIVPWGFIENNKLPANNGDVDISSYTDFFNRRCGFTRSL